MINVLQIHNKYKQQGGEDIAVNNEYHALKSSGLEVFRYIRTNDEIDSLNVLGLMKHSLTLFFKNKSYNDVKNILQNHKIDIVHIHNTFQVISPGVLRACKEYGVPVVYTLHNYRFICANGLFLRNNNVCTLCLDKRSPISSIINKCYRDSYIFTLPVALLISKIKRAFYLQDYIDKYLCLSEFSRGIFIKSGIMPDKIIVKENIINQVTCSLANTAKEISILYVGRLSEEKGINTLIKAHMLFPQLKIHIIGDGPLKQFVVDNSNKNLIYLGVKDTYSVLEYMKKSCALIMPSLCFEGMPMTIIEAYSCGTPVICSNVGSLKELVIDGKTGFKYKTGDAESLSHFFKLLYENPQLFNKMRSNVKNHFLKRYAKHIVIEKQIELYKNLINSRSDNQ